MTTETITFSYVDDTRTERQGTWTGRKNDAIEAAADYLSASEEGGSYIYTADEIQEEVVVTPDELVKLGAALLTVGENSDAYSLWAGRYGTTVAGRYGTTVEPRIFVADYFTCQSDDIDTALAAADLLADEWRAFIIATIALESGGSEQACNRAEAALFEAAAKVTRNKA